MVIAKNVSMDAWIIQGQLVRLVKEVDDANSMPSKQDFDVPFYSKYYLVPHQISSFVGTEEHGSPEAIRH
jgi:hypothetical protein